MQSIETNVKKSVKTVRGNNTWDYLTHGIDVFIHLEEKNFSCSWKHNVRVRTDVWFKWTFEKSFICLMRPENICSWCNTSIEKETKFFKSNQWWPKEINATNILRKLTFNCLFFLSRAHSQNESSRDLSSDVVLSFVIIRWRIFWKWN